MSKPIIAVDIDDVLAANAEGFVAYSNKTWGTNLTVADYHEHWSDLWKIDHDETQRRAIQLHASGAIGQYGHHPEAFGVLGALKEKYRLIIATSRRVTVEQETRGWLERRFPDIFGAVYFAGIYDQPIAGHSFHKTKLEVLQNYRASYLIDDQIKHCEAAASAGISALLFGDYPWNQAESLPEGVTRCKDWAAVLRYFEDVEGPQELER